MKLYTNNFCKTNQNSDVGLTIHCTDYFCTCMLFDLDKIENNQEIR